jgi:hypothetical protein
VQLYAVIPSTDAKDGCPEMVFSHLQVTVFEILQLKKWSVVSIDQDIGSFQFSRYSTKRVICGTQDQ